VSFGEKMVMERRVKKTPNPNRAPKIPRNADENARNADEKIDSRIKFMDVHLIK
jgi:hypothetical protein